MKKSFFYIFYILGFGICFFLYYMVHKIEIKRHLPVLQTQKLKALTKKKKTQKLKATRSCHLSF